MKIKTKYNPGDAVCCHNTAGELVVGLINEIKVEINLRLDMLAISYVLVEPYNTLAQIGEYDEEFIIGKATPKTINKYFSLDDKGDADE